VRRHLGQEGASYLHPALEPIPQETHGLILYQEQVLRIAHEVAGFSLGEADLLQRSLLRLGGCDFRANRAILHTTELPCTWCRLNPSGKSR